MRVSQPVTSIPVLPFSSIKVIGCSGTNVEFFLQDEVPSTRARRYCNKILVHECVSTPEDSPIDLSRVELLATSDPCYTYFELYKSSDLIDDIEPTITLILNEDNLTTSVLVQFTKEETCGLPLSLTYKLYGYITDTEEKILLSQGVLKIVPCKCCDCSNGYWTDLEW